jgi:hypothetical protein
MIWMMPKTRIFKENMLNRKSQYPERTAEDLEVMLSKGECAIAYANAQRRKSNVSAMH